MGTVFYTFYELGQEIRMAYRMVEDLKKEYEAESRDQYLIESDAYAVMTDLFDLLESTGKSGEEISRAFRWAVREWGMEAETVDVIAEGFYEFMIESVDHVGCK